GYCAEIVIVLITSIAYRTCYAGLIALLLLVVPQFAQQEFDDIIDISKRMVALERAGHYAEALPLAQRAVELAEDDVGQEHPSVAVYIDYLAVLYHKVGDA